MHTYTCVPCFCTLWVLQRAQNKFRGSSVYPIVWKTTKVSDRTTNTTCIRHTARTLPSSVHQDKSITTVVRPQLDVWQHVVYRVCPCMSSPSTCRRHMNLSVHQGKIVPAPAPLRGTRQTRQRTSTAKSTLGNAQNVVISLFLPNKKLNPRKFQDV